MKFLKRFNREQLTLGVAAILGVLLFGWQMTRSSGDTSTGELPKNDRFYGIGRQTTIEFIDSKVERYMVGRDIWEPPTAGRLPVPEIRPPEPRLGQITLPPLSPRPDDTEINKVSQPGKNRSLAAVVSPTPAPGFPSEAEITALKDLAEVDLAGRIVDRRKQPMRPNGLAIIHLLPPKTDIEGRIVLDSHETSDKSIVIERMVEGGSVKMTVRPDEIDTAAPAPAFEGVERGGEYGKEYKRRATRLGPDDIDGHLKLGEWSRRSAGMIPEARIEIKAAIEALGKKQDYGPRMRNAVLQLVEVLREMGEYEEAIDSIQDYIESVKGGEGADMHIHLGRLYGELGYHERSLICYDAANSLEPGAAKPRVAVARARLNLGEFRPALEQIDALLLAGGPPDAEALKVQGLARLRQGDAGGAEDSFNASLKVKPGDAETLNGLGVAQALQNKPEAPWQFFAAIKANQYLTDAWLNLAILYLSVGRPAEADVLFAGAAQRDPDSAVAAAGPAFIALLKGSFNEAGPGFDRARKIQPDDSYMAYALGRLKLREGKAKEALELFRAALKSNPEYIPATTDAALAYLMLARDEQRLAAAAPADKQAQFRDRAEGFRVNAQTLLETSYRADPTSSAANAALGCVYAVVRGKGRESRAAFDRAVRQNVPDPLIDYGRAYLEYWYGADSPKARLDLAEVGFTFGASHQDLKDPADKEWAAECAKALAAINDWRVQRIMVDERFDGNRESPSNAWMRVQLGSDPVVRFENNRAVLGDAAGTSQAGAFVALEHRDISRDNFLSVEGSLIYDATGGFESGFSLYLGELKGSGAAGGLHFVVVEDSTAPAPRPLRIYYGQMQAIRDKGPSRPNQAIGTIPAAPTSLRFKLERRDHPNKQKTWLFDFSVWDEAKGAWRQLTSSGAAGDTRPHIEVGQQLSDARTMMMQFWGKTQTPGRKWSVGVDDVRVLVVEK